MWKLQTNFPTIGKWTQILPNTQNKQHKSQIFKSKKVNDFQSQLKSLVNDIHCDKK